MKFYDSFAFSVQGANHIKVGKVCQDSSISLFDNEFSIIVVADGHGSDNYPRTDIGSYFAVAETRNAIIEFLNCVNRDVNWDNQHETFPLFEQLSKNILNRWHEKVESYTINNPIKEDELLKVSDKYKQKYLNNISIEKAYGTTLLAACLTKNYWFGLQIGDGKCVVFNQDGTSCEPIPWDEECQMNITTSLCDFDAVDEFRFFSSSSLPLAIFLGCDGIDDSYSSAEELHGLYRGIINVFTENGGLIGKSEVKDYLPILSQKGSGDDVSIAGIIKKDISKEIVELITTQAELLKAKLEYEKIRQEILEAEENYKRATADSEQKEKLFNESIEKRKRIESNFQNKKNEKEEKESKFNELSNLLSKLLSRGI